MSEKPKRARRYRWDAWAILGGYNVPKGAHPYIGQYEASPGSSWGQHQRGFPVAAYRTRAAARDALTEFKARQHGLYRNARIVRVQIVGTFEEP